MNNEFLRHTLSTISYRFQKSVQGHGQDFGEFNLGKGSRSSIEIINHMFQVMHSTHVFVLEERFDETPPEVLDFAGEVQRFLEKLKGLDTALDQQELPMPYAKKLLQGPLSDSLTHVGQIAMLSRLYGKPIEGENFAAADIETGELGA